MRRAFRAGSMVAALMAGAGGTAGAATLRGEVVGTDGGPAAGARVWAVSVRGVDLDRREAVAGADGRFALEVGPGMWAVDARLDDQGPAGSPPGATVGAIDPAPVVVRLAPAGRLRARLVEAETGRPVAGGRLMLDNGLDPAADADGRIEVRGLTRHRYHEAVVVAPGRERLRVLFEMADGPITDLEVAVPRGAKVVGRLLDPQGRPAAGASVRRVTSGNALAMRGLRVRADDRGRFEYDGFPADAALTLTAEADGCRPASRPWLRAPVDGTPLAVDFHLQPPAPGPATPAAAGRELAGVVLDPEGKPAAARVRWFDPRFGGSAEGATDAAGRFRLGDTIDVAGTLTVIPDRPDLALATRSVAAGERTVRVALEVGHVARGVVRDADGATYPGVALLPRVVDDRQRTWALVDRRAITDEHGRFAIAGLPAGEVHAGFSGPGMTALPNHPLTLDAENVVTVAPAGEIVGRVVDGDGRPVRNFRVLLRAPRDGGPADRNLRFFAGFGGIGLTCTAEDGSFVVRNLDAGVAHRVTILAPGFGAATVNRVVARPRDRRGGADVALFELGPPSVLDVEVRAADSGRPVPGARVAVVFGEPSRDDSNWSLNETRWDDLAFARAGADGLARFDPLSFDEGTILVMAPGYARQNFGWRDHAANLNARLQPESAVEGTVVDRATGLPTPGAVVVIGSRWLGAVEVPLDQQTGGRFRVGELAAGQYTLSVTTPGGGVVHSEEVTLGVGERATRDVRLDGPAP